VLEDMRLSAGGKPVYRIDESNQVCSLKAPRSNKVQ
jgi:hypothetical protein